MTLMPLVHILKLLAPLIFQLDGSHQKITPKSRTDALFLLG